MEIALRSENLTYLSETYLDISNHYSGLLNDKIAFDFFKKHIELTNKGIKNDSEIKEMIFESLRPVRFENGKGY